MKINSRNVVSEIFTKHFVKGSPAHWGNNSKLAKRWKKWISSNWPLPLSSCLISLARLLFWFSKIKWALVIFPFPLLDPGAMIGRILLHCQIFLWEKMLLTLYNTILQLNSPPPTDYFHNEKTKDLWILQNLCLTRFLWMVMHRWAGMSLIHYCTHTPALFIINDIADIFLSSGTE